MVNLASPREKGNNPFLSPKWQKEEDDLRRRRQSKNGDEGQTDDDDSTNDRVLAVEGVSILLRNTLIATISSLIWVVGAYGILVWQRFPFHRHRFEVLGILGATPFAAFWIVAVIELRMRFAGTARNAGEILNKASDKRDPNLKQTD
jgi:hypothetical protein